MNLVIVDVKNWDFISVDNWMTLVKIVQFGFQLFSCSRNVETVMWVVAKRWRFMYCSHWKHSSSLSLLCLQSLHAKDLQYLSSITKWEYNSLRAGSVHTTEHRLLVTGFSLQRWLVSHILKVDNSCVHQVSSDLLIGSVAFPHSTSSLILRGERAETQTVSVHYFQQYLNITMTNSE